MLGLLSSCCVSSAILLCDLIKHTSEVCDRRLHASAAAGVVVAAAGAAGEAAEEKDEFDVELTEVI